MDARAVKDALYSRHHASGLQMPGAWTVIEEFRNIDLLAFSSWSSASRYARIGYEVKVSRADLRSELLKPYKRASNVAWCNEFYFAVPAGLLTDEELAWVEPEWVPEDWMGERCPGFLGRPCRPWSSRRKTHRVVVPVPSTNWFQNDVHIICPTCDGRGVTAKSRVELEAPTVWVPADVGLIVVKGNGTRVVKKSPRRKEVPALRPEELGKLVRWISMRPDPRHANSNHRRQIERGATS